MTGAKKRPGSPIADAVHSKAPISGTVALEKSSQIQNMRENDHSEKSNEKPSIKSAPQVASEVETSKTEAQIPQATEKTQKVQTSAATEETSKTNIKKSPEYGEELWADIQKLSPHMGIILQGFIKQYNDSLMNIKKKDLVVSKKMRAIVMDSLKKKAENITLKGQLSHMEMQLTQVKKDLLKQQEKYAENAQKYMEINKKYVHCEKYYDTELEIIKACMEKRNSELKDAQSRIALQGRELNNMQQTNRQLAGTCTAYKTDLEQAEVANSKIQQELAGFKQMYEALTVQFEDISAQKENCEANILQLSTDLNAKILACTELAERIEQMPIEANKVLSKLQSDLEASELRFVEQQRLTDQTTKELELLRNQINTSKTLIEEKESRHVSLSNELTQMTERLNELVDINESYLNELTESKLKHSQEIKEQAEAYEILSEHLSGKRLKLSASVKPRNGVDVFDRLKTSK
uniref:GG20377 n=1 Tax=Drosophila erecta TaxID=7220 RepID=B3P3V1_DROER